MLALVAGNETTHTEGLEHVGEVSRLPNPAAGGLVLSRCGECRVSYPCSPATREDFERWMEAASLPVEDKASPSRQSKTLSCEWRAEMRACVDSPPVVLLQPANDLCNQTTSGVLMCQQQMICDIKTCSLQAFQIDICMP